MDKHIVLCPYSGMWFSHKKWMNYGCIQQWIESNNYAALKISDKKVNTLWFHLFKTTEKNKL